MCNDSYLHLESAEPSLFGKADNGVRTGGGGSGTPKGGQAPGFGWNVCVGTPHPLSLAIAPQASPIA